MVFHCAVQSLCNAINTNCNFKKSYDLSNCLVTCAIYVPVVNEDSDGRAQRRKEKGILCLHIFIYKHPKFKHIQHKQKERSTHHKYRVRIHSIPQTRKKKKNLLFIIYLLVWYLWWYIIMASSWQNLTFCFFAAFFHRQQKLREITISHINSSRWYLVSIP